MYGEEIMAPLTYSVASASCEYIFHSKGAVIAAAPFPPSMPPSIKSSSVGTAEETFNDAREERRLLRKIDLR